MIKDLVNQCFNEQANLNTSYIIYEFVDVVFIYFKDEIYV